MEERLFLDRVNVEGAGVAIDQRVKRAVAVDLVAAMAAVARLQDAIVGADLALDVAAELEVMPRLFHPAAFLPQFPNLARGRVAFEDVGRGLGLAPFGEEIEKRNRARQAGHTRCAKTDGGAARDSSR